jgi:hypothetical protein
MSRYGRATLMVIDERGALYLETGVSGKRLGVWCMVAVSGHLSSQTAAIDGRCFVMAVIAAKGPGVR